MRFFLYHLFFLFADTAVKAVIENTIAKEGAFTPVLGLFSPEYELFAELVEDFAVLEELLFFSAVVVVAVSSETVVTVVVAVSLFKILILP